MSTSDIISTESAKLLKENPDSILVDVRTENEWREIGIPDFENEGLNNTMLLNTIIAGQDLDMNDSFGNYLLDNIEDKDAPIMFICKSGGRSSLAAYLAGKLGYNKCYNIVDGFEGNSLGRGWKNNLSWKYY